MKIRHDLGGWLLIILVLSGFIYTFTTTNCERKMMHHLHYTKCPHCKARPIMKIWSGQHTNGQHFEKIHFSCQCVIAWVPNFSHEETVFPCSNDPKEIEKEKKRSVALTSVIKFIESLDVDDKYKKKLVNQFSR